MQVRWRQKSREAVKQAVVGRLRGADDGNIQQAAEMSWTALVVGEATNKLLVVGVVVPTSLSSTSKERIVVVHGRQ